MSPVRRMAVVALFAGAMGYLEAAVVYYLRTMVDRIVPHQSNPLPDIPALAIPELAREVATLVMLATLGLLAGKTWRARAGFALLAFGVWDITYYLFLIPLTQWPKTLLDWDILFLIPLPWWGPVIAPVSIALLMIGFGVLTTILELGDPPIWPRKLSTAVSGAGILLALFVFMHDAIAALPQGEAAVRQVLPQAFSWSLFIIAWFLMAFPVADMGRQLLNRYK